jgi:hypothetical protein
MTKAVAQSATRRQSLRTFAGGLLGLALAWYATPSGATPPSSGSNCIPSGEFCGTGNGKPGCNHCCSGSFFCENESDIGKDCFCN